MAGIVFVGESCASSSIGTLDNDERSPIILLRLFDLPVHQSGDLPVSSTEASDRSADLDPRLGPAPRSVDAMVIRTIIAATASPLILDSVTDSVRPPLHYHQPRQRLPKKIHTQSNCVAVVGKQSC